jgi:hypothetical protein
MYVCVDWHLYYLDPMHTLLYHSTLYRRESSAKLIMLMPSSASNSSAKMGILLVVDLERTNIEFVVRALEYNPIYHVDDSPSPEELSSTKHI